MKQLGARFHICNPVTKTHVGPRSRPNRLPAGLTPCIQLSGSIPHTRCCPDCAFARSDMIPVLTHLAITYLDIERNRVYDPVMPFPASFPLSLR